MSKGMRVLAVTGGLILTGMVVGALCAVVAFPLIFLPLGLPRDVSQSALLAIAAVLGAIIGGVLAPVVAWGLLRRVPALPARRVPIGWNVGLGHGFLAMRNARTIPPASSASQRNTRILPEMGLRSARGPSYRLHS